MRTGIGTVEMTERITSIEIASDKHKKKRKEEVGKLCTNCKWMQTSNKSNTMIHISVTGRQLFI